jgi:hypothetical protein
MKTVSLSCGRSATPNAIPEHLSSSSLPPSLAPGRRTAVFTPRGVARSGTPLRLSGGRP